MVCVAPGWQPPRWGATPGPPQLLTRPAPPARMCTGPTALLVNGVLAVDRRVTRIDLAVYVLDVLGGRTQVVPTRDIAEKCYELASGWYKRTQDSDRVDMGIVRQALTAAARVKNGS